MNNGVDAYLDIETTGLSFSYDYITLIGVYRYSEEGDSLVQLIGDKVTAENLNNALIGVSTIYSYNGQRFDLPFIKRYLGIDLELNYDHHDLMYDCWRLDLYGGLKAVEKLLGIDRQLKDVNGFMAVVLWQKYIDENDYEALRTLLKYNEEDVINLKTLRDRLEVFTD